MKNNGYLYFLFRTFLRMFLSMLIVVGVVCFLLYLHSRFFAWDIMLLLEKYNLYEPWIEHKTVIICIVLCCLALVAFGAIIVRFARHLHAIEQTVALIFEDAHSPIHLPKELKELQDKLIQLQSKMEQRELAAKESELRKNDLIVYLAHDLKTPLSSIIGYLNLLQESPDLPVETKAQYVDITLDRALRLEELITELFDITKFNLHDITLEKDVLNLSMMLRQILEEFYPLFMEHGITVEDDIASGLMYFGDGDKLARVFDNLLKNAVNYCYDNSTLHIQAKEHRRTVYITISNEGDTIPPEKLSLIFEKFYRVDSARSTSTGGSGLGLAIAREIVKLHKGYLTAKSSNHVTTFEIQLPKTAK